MLELTKLTRIMRCADVWLNIEHKAKRLSIAVIQHPELWRSNIGLHLNDVSLCVKVEARKFRKKRVSPANMM